MTNGTLAATVHAQGALVKPLLVDKSTGAIPAFRWQPDEVLYRVFDVSAGALCMMTVPTGTGVTAAIWQTNEVLSAAYDNVNKKLQVNVVTASTFAATLLQPNEIWRNVFDPSVGVLRVAKVSTGGGPIAGRRWQVDEILSGSYDPGANALRVVSVGAGSGPTTQIRQPNEVLSLCYDPKVHAIQETGV